MGSTAQRQLLDALEAQCAGGQSIPLSAFMQQVLSHPEYGYYAQNTAIGAEGDFITAPEISPLFGEIIGAFLTYVWALSGKPDAGNALYFEAGPGRGSLLADIMRVFSHHDCALKDSQLTLLETSQKLQTQLRTHLVATVDDRDISRQLQVISRPDNLPEMPIFGVANEFFDALGVDQAILTDTGWYWHEVFCTAPSSFHLAPARPLTADEIASHDLPSDAGIGTIIERSSMAESVTATLAAHIARYGGVLVIADYGKSDNIGDTIQAVKQHNSHPFFKDIGTADLTHLVDFSALARQTEAQQARFIGPVFQADFLKELGLFERTEALRRPDQPEFNRQLVAGAERLTSPAQMGQIFKIAAILPAGEGLPPGFSTYTAPSETIDRMPASRSHPA